MYNIGQGQGVIARCFDGKNEHKSIIAYFLRGTFPDSQDYRFLNQHQALASEGENHEAI